MFTFLRCLTLARTGVNVRNSKCLTPYEHHTNHKIKVQTFACSFMQHHHAKHLSKMKTIFQLLFLFTLSPCLAQPTGHQKLFLAFRDKGDTIHFEKSMGTAEDFTHYKTLTQPKYQLTDISANASGFSWYPPNEFIHKTLMTQNHRLRLVKNRKDTMTIEINNAFNVYFLCISFQKGHFRLYVNDGVQHKWLFNTLPYKRLNNGTDIYDITPPDWRLFEVNAGKIPQDYFISTQFRKLNILAKPVAPEDDPNFRNPRRVNNLRIELADYNFDGQQDYRERKMNDPNGWNYFLYTNPSTGFVLDTLLSQMDVTSFDPEKKQFVGQKTTRVNNTTTQRDNYTYINGQLTLVAQQICVHASLHSEKMDCTVYELKNGQMVFKQLIKGAE